MLQSCFTEDVLLKIYVSALNVYDSLQNEQKHDLVFICLDLAAYRNKEQSWYWLLTA